MPWDRVAFYGLVALAVLAMWLLRAWARRAFVPDNCEGRPYDWTVNQVSHWALGMAVYWFFADAGFRLLGEYPYRWELWIIAVALVVQFECCIQPLHGEDTVHDVVFMGVYGAGGAALAFAEVTPGSRDLTMQPENAAWLGCVMVLHLAWGVLRRV